MARRSNKEVATTDGVLAHRPDWADKSHNRGSEDVGMDDVAIPRIDVIQDLSPQRKKDKPEYIEGADTGMIFNTVTNHIYGDSVDIVPVVFRKEYVIWRDRDAGGGFRGAFRMEEDAAEALSRLEDKDQCEVVDTAQHFVLVVSMDNGERKLEEAVVSMAKSKMKPSRKLNSLCRQIGGDRFSAVYRLRSVPASGPKGDYVNMDVAFQGFCPEEIYQAGETMYKAVIAGSKDVDRTDHRPGANDTSEEDY